MAQLAHNISGHHGAYQKHKSLWRDANMFGVPQRNPANNRVCTAQIKPNYPKNVTNKIDIFSNIDISATFKRERGNPVSNFIPRPMTHIQSSDKTTADKTDQKGIIVFDFDGTITTKDTFALFLRYYAGTWQWARNLIMLLPVFVRYKCGLIDRHAVKKAVVKTFFSGHSAEALEAKAEQFAREVIPKYIRPQALSRLNVLKNTTEFGPDFSHESLYICSASIGPYLRYWAKTQNIDANHVLATELESKNGTLTGALKGYNVWGANKVRRIYDALSPQCVHILEAYGDTRGDREMLHAAKVSFYRPFRF